MSDSIAALQARREAMQRKRQAKLGQAAGATTATTPAAPAPAPAPAAAPATLKRPREEESSGNQAKHGIPSLDSLPPAEKRARAMAERRLAGPVQSTTAASSVPPSRSSAFSKPSLPLPPAAFAPSPPSVYNAALNIPQGKIQEKDGHVPEHWRARDTTHSLMQDYSQHFVNRGSCSDRPSNFIRNETESDRTGGDKDYAAYVRRSQEIVGATNSRSPYMAKRIDLSSSEELLATLDTAGGTEFDVIMIDPPWQEYVDRSAAGSSSLSSESSWSASQVARLPIPQLAAEPCILFLWCGAGKHVAEAHAILVQWGFHKIEDICWLQTNRTHANLPGYTDGEGLFQRTFEHCLVAVRGMEWILRDRTISSLPYATRQDLGLVQFLNPGVDIDVIVSEVAEYGSTEKIEQIYELIERYCNGRRRLELFGTDNNIRNGWMTLGLGITQQIEKFDIAEWRARHEQPVKLPMIPEQPAGTPPFDARTGGHYLPFDPVLESLRPKSPQHSQRKQRKVPRERRRGAPPRTPAVGAAANGTVQQGRLDEFREEWRKRGPGATTANNNLNGNGHHNSLAVSPSNAAYSSASNPYRSAAPRYGVSPPPSQLSSPSAAHSPYTSAGGPAASPPWGRFPSSSTNSRAPFGASLPPLAPFRPPIAGMATQPPMRSLSPQPFVQEEGSFDSQYGVEDSAAAGINTIWR